MRLLPKSPKVPDPKTSRGGEGMRSSHKAWLAQSADTLVLVPRHTLISRPSLMASDQRLLVMCVCRIVA